MASPRSDKGGAGSGSEAFGFSFIECSYVVTNINAMTFTARDFSPLGRGFQLLTPTLAISRTPLLSPALSSLGGRRGRSRRVVVQARVSSLLGGCQLARQ